MENKTNIEIDKDFIEQLYSLAKEPQKDYNKVDLDELKRVLNKIRDMIPTTHIKEEPFDTFGIDESAKKVLIVDDLGTITYQLGTMLTKKGFNTVCSNEIYDAIAKYKKQKFDVVILDLFIPTEREGFIILEEILKLNEQKKEKALVGIMSASSKREHKQLCKERGADFYIEKADDWQKNILEICESVQNR